MGMTIRPEVSKKNRWWISKHRYYELKHFCLQYREWKKRYRELEANLSGDICFVSVNGNVRGSKIRDKTGEIAAEMAELSRCIGLVEKLCDEADLSLSEFIFKAVTEDMSYAKLSVMYEIPCGQDMYYDRYHKFFWLLDKER